MDQKYERLKRDHGRKHTQVYELIEDGLQTDGAHHKQWYLEQIAIVMGWNIEHLYDEVERGIAP